MSINFDIMKWLSNKSFDFPVACTDAPNDLDSDDFASVPWPELRQLFKEAGARVNFDEDHLVLEFGNEGTLFICGLQGSSVDSDNYILVSFKVHTYWTHVLDIYKKSLVGCGIDLAILKI